jgi:hypothetical protein
MKETAQLREESLRRRCQDAVWSETGSSQTTVVELLEYLALFSTTKGILGA